MFDKDLCAICHKNPPAVFVTKFDEHGHQSNEGICLMCAKKMGIQPVNQMLDRFGLDDDALDNLNNEMHDMMEYISKPTSDENEEDLPEPDEEQESRLDAPNLFEMLKNFPITAKKEDTEEGDSSSNTTADPKTEKGKKDKKKGKKKYLDLYGQNLNDKASAGKLDNVIGRDREIDRVIQILNRRTKNNPVLIGEPGVGKTAIAEGLAEKIVNNQIPYKLLNKQVYLLDLTAMVAGTQFRGQFEMRMKGVIDEAKESGNVILVIDEIHNIMGAGEAEGAMNAANILKPALSRGEIQVIGATTLNEYRKYIEKDGALERRFQPVYVNEPTIEETVEILQGLKHYYEDFHKVRISDSIIKDTVKMSERYITDRFLPDKAIDVVDEAASKANLRNMALVALSRSRDEAIKLNEKIEEMESNANPDDYKEIAELKSKLALLGETIKTLEKNEFIELEFNDVAAVIENWTGVPVQTITEAEADKLLHLEERLKKRVIGQEKAVVALSKAIRRNRSGFKKLFRPSSFIFVGPTGVGKTELVKSIAIELFGSIDALVRLDMSEYMERHTVSKLIGSPPGYVGYDEAGQLTEKIRRRPYSVILLDEIEKAHADVFNILLQILDDGRLTDSQGRTVNFENTVIVMTSNAGNSIKNTGIGFIYDDKAAVEDNAKDALKMIFRPEFLNRVDDVIVFNKLDKKELHEIARLMLKEVIDSSAEKDIELTYDESVVDFIVKNGYDEKYGARPLRRLIQKKIEDELAEMHLRGSLKYGSKVFINVEKDDIVILVD